jgi:hypothetical protein
MRTYSLEYYDVIQWCNSVEILTLLHPVCLARAKSRENFRKKLKWNQIQDGYRKSEKKVKFYMEVAIFCLKIF